jgi:quercetin dioxygenase-like cupin family protein
MFISTPDKVEKKPVTVDGAENVQIQWLIGPDSAAPHFYLRLFTVAPGGYSPFHTHEMEHEIYVVAGTGRINHEKGFTPVQPGAFALVSPNEKHQFENTGQEPFQFLCIIPKG